MIDPSQSSTRNTTTHSEYDQRTIFHQCTSKQDAINHQYHLPDYLGGSVFPEVEHSGIYAHQQRRTAHNQSATGRGMQCRLHDL